MTLSTQRIDRMSLIYVFAAMKTESQAVERLIGLKPDSASRAPVKAGQCGSNELVLFTTGMGPRRARARAAAAFGPGIAQTGPADRSDAAIVIGLCGGLSPSLGEGTIVSYTKCLSTENSQSPLSCSPSLVDQQVALLTSKGLPCERVVGITSPRVGTPLGEKSSLAKSGASVVDMESYEIIAAATQAGVPTTVLRIVADSVDQEMPDFNRALKPDGDFDGWKALKVALGSPVLTAKLIAANRRAIRKLTPALEVLLASDCFTDTRRPAVHLTSPFQHVNTESGPPPSALWHNLSGRGTRCFSPMPGPTGLEAGATLVLFSWMCFGAASSAQTATASLKHLPFLPFE